MELLLANKFYIKKYFPILCCLNKIYVGKSSCTYQCVQNSNSAIWGNSWLVLLKNSINISNNVNLILNTYRCPFFFKMLLKIFDVVLQLRPCRRVSKTVWKWKGSGINWKLSFLHRLTFNWCTSWRRVAARWWRQWAKNQCRPIKTW